MNISKIIFQLKNKNFEINKTYYFKNEVKYLGKLIYTECEPSFFESIVDNNYIDVTPVKKEPLLIEGN